MQQDCKVCAAVSKWLKKPYDSEGNVIDWFLFIGLMGIISWLWTRILKRII